MELADIVVGTKLRILDHDYGNDGRDDVTVTAVTPTGFTLTPKRPWSSQGRVFRTMHVHFEGEWKWSVDRMGQPVLTSYRKNRYAGGLTSVKSFVFGKKRV